MDNNYNGVPLYKAILFLKNENEAEKFLRDICTPGEMRDLNERWLVAQMLSDGASYRQINELTGISTTTVGRVARFLKEEDYQGYKLILERVKKKQRIKFAERFKRIKQLIHLKRNA